MFILFPTPFGFHNICSCWQERLCLVGKNSYVEQHIFTPLLSISLYILIGSFVILLTLSDFWVRLFDSNPFFVRNNVLPLMVHEWWNKASWSLIHLSLNLPSLVIMQDRDWFTIKSPTIFHRVLLLSLVGFYKKKQYSRTFILSYIYKC